MCSFPHYVEEISSSRRPPSLHINRIDSERGSSIRYIVLLLLWLMAYSASNYSSNKEIDVGFSCLSAVSRDANPAVRSNSTLSAPVYSYRPVSSNVGNNHRPSRSQDYEHQYPMKQATKHPEPREREYCSGSYDRRPHSRALPANHPNQKISTEPMVNPFDQFSDGTSHHSRATLGYHTSHSVPSMVESETSDGMYSADDIKNLYSHEQDTIQERSSAVNKDDCYPYDQQKQPPTRMENNSSRYRSSINSHVQYKQPPQFHQPLYLKKPPPDLAPPAPAAAPTDLPHSAG